MDDLVSEFLTETNESLEIIDVELVKFEQEPNNARILDNIFRLVHTIKGTCGFLGLPRLEALAHAAETVMGRFRDGVPVTPGAVTLILASIDRIKDIITVLGETGQEPEGSDTDMIARLEEMALEAPAPAAATAVPGDALAEAAAEACEPEPVLIETAEPALVVQTLERELRPGEVSLDELERAFRETPGPETETAEAEAPPTIEEEPEDVAPVAQNDSDRGKAPANREGNESARGDTPVKSQTIRVAVDTLEHLITTVSELVLTRNQLLEIVRRHEDSEFKVPLQRLSNVTAELQEGVMKTRMQPIGNAWQKLPRIVRDLALELDKQIELEMVGAETELDRQVLELIKDPLTHMVRNSADHGLELPEQRKTAGKPKVGKVRLAAYHEGGHIIIEIADDGRGLDSTKISKKLLEKGLVTEAELEKMSEAQIHRFIFNPGFSTAEKVTSVSGRGVGMDVVKTNIELIGGTVDVKSVQGEGSVFTIKIPLTLAIVSALIVESSGQRFAIPQLAVVELVHTGSGSATRIERIKDTPVLRLRDELLPLVGLSSVLGLPPKMRLVANNEAGADNDVRADNEARDATGQTAAGTATDGRADTKVADTKVNDTDGFIVVLQVGSHRFGIVVDAVFHTEEIVVKPMSSMLRSIAAFSGNTILGDGSVIMIIDPNGIAKEVRTDVAAELERDSLEDTAALRDETVSMLLFRAGSAAPKAVPLSLITRLEEIEVDRMEHANGRSLVQYRGRLMPLVHVNDTVERRTEGSQPMIVFTDNGRSMGLVIDEVVDIVDDRLDIQIPSETPGILGSAVIRGSATEVIDVAHYLPMAFEDWFHRKETGAVPEDTRIMLIDDSPFFRNMIAPVLKSAGYRTIVCESAMEALQRLEAGEPVDVVVSDIEMPEMSGYELAERLSATGKFKDLPIVALSSLASPEAIERGRKAGFHDYVAKFDRTGLLESLKEMARPMGEAA
ncbi:hybrid sensor histidine kinase/response regulator [Microbaculum marinisediminis]|uniref:Chemotaxis protein CheA n=1 Tax=Microbaculum marinisediminis TaxID=2931392 RepID=A0AAW5QZC9_9HYPH|nr:hybrid sensor histidine kinase/response regulator [Microbaculum sp. A6E488]MCT8971773.1 hybrid sensor histidine kinase/response regulator [Microbaculum sp. A6E488]